VKRWRSIEVGMGRLGFSFEGMVDFAKGDVKCTITLQGLNYERDPP